MDAAVANDWSPERVRALRAALGWSQERLARAMNVGWCSVSRWENGHARPSQLARAALERLARGEDAA